MLGLFLTLVFFVVCFFGIKGYVMYQEAVEKTPVSEIGVKVRSIEGFTPYDELPRIYIDAVIAAEDKRFEVHGGVDFIAIGRAVLTDIKTMSLAEGGSTITQQLAKNQLFNQEKRMERKFAELFADFALEKEYSKKEIFEMYVNTIYFGSGYYGIYAAAQGYFGKTPADLTDAEAVMLAGLPNAPSVYSPKSNPALAKRRMYAVLLRMVDCGRLTKHDAERIRGEPVTVKQ